MRFGAKVEDVLGDGSEILLRRLALSGSDTQVGG